MGTMLKAYKYIIYTNVDQQIYISKVCGYSRFIYSKILDNRIEVFK